MNNQRYPSLNRFLHIIIFLPAVFLFQGSSPVFAVEKIPSPIAVERDVGNNSIKNTTKLQWVDPAGSRPITYLEWKADRGVEAAFEIHFVNTESARKSDPADIGFCVIINSALYASIQPEIDQYIFDLTGVGYNVELYASLGGTPQELRDFLQPKYAAGTQGAVLIGDLPVPWYETDFGDPPEHAEFPIDLYYMDMDGNFDDVDKDGLYDSHTGDVGPEIWVGRLTASPLTMDGADEITLMQNYFAKNHLYHCDLMPVANRALVYIDDDWSPGNWWNMNVGQAFSNRNFIRDDWVTWSDDYEGHLSEDYEHVLVCVHSWPGGHGFKNPLDEWGWTYNYEIKAIGPKANFYNLFACSAARYVEEDYVSGWYIFGPDHGLVSIGSAKTGSMLNFDDFYSPLGEGKEIGRAFMEWFDAQAVDGFEEWEITWFYGMTLNGDPTLTIQNKPNSEIMQYDNGQASYTVSLPDPSGYNMMNVRFTPDKPCTLSSVSVEGIFPQSSPVRMYIWESDGVYPTTVIDSLTIADGDISYIDLYEENLIFDADQNFHIGFSSVDPAPAESLWIYMDDGGQSPENRSGWKQGDNWLTLYQTYGIGYNFLIRVEARYETEPHLTITTQSLPDGTCGQVYDESLGISGGVAPYSWEVTAGALPEGIILDSEKGDISGSPTEVGEYIIVIRVTDSDSPIAYDIQHLSLTVDVACGDANGDGSVNMGDAGYVINYIFYDGPAPVAPDAGDANGDGSTNLADAGYIINYIFYDGPAPNCN